MMACKMNLIFDESRDVEGGKLKNLEDLRRAAVDTAEPIEVVPVPIALWQPIVDFFTALDHAMRRPPYEIEPSDALRLGETLTRLGSKFTGAARTTV